MEISGGIIMLSWLPEILDYTKYSNIQIFVDDIYNIFITDFLVNRIKFKNYNVGLSDKILKCTPQEYCKSQEYKCYNCPFKNKLDTFNHVVTGKLNTHRTPGKFNLNRAIRIHWIKPIIENYNNGVCYFSEPDKKNGTTHYFWLKEEKYTVIIVETKTHKLFLKTAFFIDDITYEKNLENKYKKYLLKKSTTKIAD